MKTFSVLDFFFFTISLTLISSSISQDNKEHIELTPPLSFWFLTPSCTHLVLNHTFTTTVDNSSLHSTPYTPPLDCPSPWTHVVLQLEFIAGSSSSNQGLYCISGLWLGGSELLRTSTPQLSTNNSTILWRVKKDITKYSSLLQQTSLTLTMMLQNVASYVDVSEAAVYDVTVTLLFYKYGLVTVPSNSINNLNLLRQPETNAASAVRGLYEKPADMILPISRDDIGGGIWFKVKNEFDMPTKQIIVPTNTHRAVMEVFVSFHADDEYWYSNPPTSYLRNNNICSLQGNSNYREVFVTIDGACVGTDLPFPVVFPGGINPFLWKPVVGIGAFDLPSYDFDITPFLQKVVDGEVHEFGVGVSHSIPYWLVDANLHLWLDKEYGFSSVPAGTVIAQKPKYEMQTKEEFKGLDGEFEIKGKGRSESQGWVVSSAGNLTTFVSKRLKLQSNVQFKDNGTRKIVKLQIKSNKKVRVLNERGQLVSSVVVKRKYPLNLMNTTLADKVMSNLTNIFEERYINGDYSRSTYNKQETNGWIEITNQTSSTISSPVGGATVRQTLTVKDGFNCYTRSVSVADGKMSEDQLSSGCNLVS